MLVGECRAVVISLAMRRRERMWRGMERSVVWVGSSVVVVSVKGCRLLVSLKWRLSLGCGGEVGVTSMSMSLSWMAKGRPKAMDTTLLFFVSGYGTRCGDRGGIPIHHV